MIINYFSCYYMCSGQFCEFSRIEPRVLPHQDCHKWRPSSPYQVSHSTPRRETSGLTLTSQLAPRREILGLAPSLQPNPEQKTAYFPVVISPCSKHVPILVGAVTDSSGYLGTSIPTIKHNNPSSYKRIPTRKSCRYETPKISIISYVYSGYLYSQKLMEKGDNSRLERTKLIQI